MLRKIAGVVAGLLVAIFLISLVQKISVKMYPPPADLSIEDKEAFAAYVAGLPFGALALVLLSYTLGSFGGAWTAGRVARALSPAIVVGGVLTLGAIANLRMVPHPLWFSIVTLSIFLPVAYLGGRLASGRG